MGDKSDWFWKIAMDGVGGAIVAGLVTVTVLLVTLGWERKRQTRSAASAEAKTVMAHTQTLRAMMQNLLPESGKASRLAIFQSMQVSLELVSVLTERTDPEFSDIVDTWRERLSRSVAGVFHTESSEKYGQVLAMFRALNGDLGSWIAHPHRYRSMNAQEVASYKQSIWERGHPVPGHGMPELP